MSSRKSSDKQTTQTTVEVLEYYLCDEYITSMLYTRMSNVNDSKVKTITSSLDLLQRIALLTL